MEKSLKGKVALVAGGSRGAGRAIALELGYAGAKVFVTGRSIKGQSTNNWRGTIDDIADEIKAAGGACIPIKCDHKNDSEVEQLFNFIDQQGGLDILVNNVWGGSEFMQDHGKFWDRSLTNWDTMFTGGIRAQIVTNKFAIPLIRKTGHSLIIHPTFWDDDKYTGFFYYDLAKNAINRMVNNLSIELKNDNIPVIAVSPGWMRTEIVLETFKTDENHWHEIKDLENTESPRYVGRAVVALSSDPKLINKTGKILRVSDLAREYGFYDIDGRQPDAYHIS